MTLPFFEKIRISLDMIKFEHTVFALPFAFLGAILAARGIPSLTTCAWILLAMIGARSSAMAFNRLIDEPIDRNNPRTRARALPSGRISRGYVIGFTLVNAGLFIFSAYMLNLLSFVLSLPALAVILFYSYTKRFTSLSHIVLGMALSIAPAGGWIAVRGTFSIDVLLLCLVVVTWVAGFDILYACQDVEFDSLFGLYSIPQKVGVTNALRISFACHLLTIASLLALVHVFELSWFSLAGIVFLSLLLIWEHLIIHADDLSRINTAFFTMNGFFSILLFFIVFIDVELFLH